MVNIRLDELLKEKNKTRYWLAKKIDSSQHTISVLAKNETTSIRFDTLEKICEALDCSPSDIITFKK